MQKLSAMSSPEPQRNGQHGDLGTSPVYTLVFGTNADLIANAARQYLHPGDVICDVTFGKGVFWRKVDRTAYKFFGTDITGHRSVDFRNLPYGNGFADHLILDPPYSHGQDHVGAHYDPWGTARRMTHADIISDFYGGGLREAWRVLKPGRLAWVKCCDEIEAGKQKWSHIEILMMAQELGFTGVELFILHRAATPMLRQKRQINARKNHSFLWILRKPSKSPPSELCHRRPGGPISERQLLLGSLEDMIDHAQRSGEDRRYVEATWEYLRFPRTRLTMFLRLLPQELRAVWASLRKR
jgi:hypothetical protein